MEKKKFDLTFRIGVFMNELMQTVKEERQFSSTTRNTAISFSKWLTVKFKTQRTQNGQDSLISEKFIIPEQKLSNGNSINEKKEN